jgi:hypothetical protein
VLGKESFVEDFMKWPYKKLKYPSIGDTRFVKKFAWLPTVIGDEKVWLEPYLSFQRVLIVKMRAKYNIHGFCEETKVIPCDLADTEVNEWEKFKNSWAVWE